MISTAELAQKEFTGITLPAPYGSLLGKIPIDVSGAIWGPKGSGKSTMAVDLAYVLANQIGKGIYCSSEEGPGPSMQGKITRLGAQHDDLMVTDFEGLEDLKSAVKYSQANFVVLDSASMGYVNLHDFEAFHGWCKEQNVMLWYILHATKDGNYKGNTMMVHMPDIEIKVSGGMAETEKNRFEETPRQMEVVFERGKGETEDGKRDNPNRESFEIGDEIKGKKIVGIQRIIHGPLFPNRSIVSRIVLKGPRGGKYYGEVYRNGKISIQNGDYGYFEGEKTLAGSRKNPVTFIETSDNTLDFGEITPAIARKIRRQSGKIRLTKEGLDHVKSHEDEIKDVGFESIIKFIEAVIRKFDAIYEDRGALFLAIKNKPSKMAVVRLDRFRNGDFYVIKTALPVRSDYLEKKKLLWDTAQSNHRNNATPGAISGHNSFDTQNTKNTNKRENPADMLAGLPYIENPGPELRENKGIPPEDIYDMITDNIISVIASDEELPWQKRYGTGFEHGLATNFVSKNAYRGINWVMLNFFKWIKEDGKKKLVRGRFSTPYFLTFNQVDDLDGSIKEGAVAQRAFFFSLLYSYEQSDPDLEFSSFDRKEFIAWLSEHSSQITGLVANEQSIKKFADQSVIPIVKYYNLFNGEDIEGIDFGGDYDDQKLSDADKLKTAELIFDSYPNRPPVKHGQQQPFYDRKKDFINMPKFGSYEEPQYYYSTLFHESVHSTGHKDRLDREFGKKFGDDKYAFEELVAEMGAAFLSAEAGILFHTLDQSAAYLKNWNERLIEAMQEHNTFFFRAASRSQEAADYVLDRNDDGVPAYHSEIEAENNEREPARKNPKTGTECIVNARAKTNDGKDGIEIRFSDAPPKDIRDRLKAAEFIFYTPKDKPPFWAALKSKQTKEVAESIAGKFDSAVVNLKPKSEKQEAEIENKKIESEDTEIKNTGNTPETISLKSANPTLHHDIRLGFTPTKKAILFFGDDYDNRGNLTGPYKIIGRAKDIVDARNSDFHAWDEGLQKKYQRDIDDLLRFGKKKAKSKKPKTQLNYELGAQTTVDFKADGSIQESGHFALMEATDVIPSHNKDCSRNSAHNISKGQPRDRSLDALCSQPKFIAQHLNPVSITRGNLAFNGTSTIIPDGQVIQGNGRDIALKIAYSEHPKKAQKYRSYLAKNAADWGFTKKEVQSFNQPVLERVIDVSKERAIALGNVVDTSQAKMSKIDQGKAYIRNLPKAKKQAVGNLINDSAGETLGEVINDVGIRIMDQFKDLDRQELVEENSLTSDGKDFLRSVFAGLVFDSDEHKQALQHFLKIKHRQKAGLERSYGNIIPFIDSKADLTDTIQQAVEIVSKVQNNDSIDTAGDFLSQSDAFSGSNAEQFSKQSAQLAKFLLGADTQKAIRNGFRMYQWKINGKEDLFNPIKKVSPNEAFNDAFIAQLRINPTQINPVGPLIYIGETERIDIDTGNDKKGVQGAFPTFVSDNMLYIVPAHRVAEVVYAVEAEKAIAGYEKWHNYEADNTDYEIDWPEKTSAKAVGTALRIWYASDKVIQEGDAKGEMNFYVHDFDSGKRPAVVKDDILIIGNIEWNERGILN